MQKVIKISNIALFYENFGLEIDYQREIYLYSPNKWNDNSIMIANVHRPGDTVEPFHYEYFKMLYGSINKDTKSMIHIVCSFLRHYCHVDMKRIGIVSLTENNQYSLPGIEPFIETFLKNGILRKNILVRNDVDNVVKNADGNGYWKNPYDDNHCYPTFSIFYPLTRYRSITEFTDSSKWLEIGEASIGNQIGFCIGFERLEYLFF